MLPSNVTALLLRVVHALEQAKVDYAIGGAVAMAAHGYARHTADVDIFSTDASRTAVLRALRAEQIVAAPIMPPFHYVIMAEGSNGEERIDLLFASAEPDLSAVEFPSRIVVIPGLEANVYPASLLAVAKFYANRPKDHADLLEMLNRGIFDPAQIEAIIASLDPEDASQFRELIARLTTSEQRQHPTKRLPRKRDV